MPQTVIITLTTAGLDTGPFNLYSDVDGYVTPFETGVTKPSLLVGYVSTLVPNAATIIRVKSVNELCTNYIDLTIPTTTTTTTSSSTSTTSTSSTTTTTTTTAFECVDCRNWEYNGATIPEAGDVIHYYRCSDGAPQTIVLSNGDPTGQFCNCNSIDDPYSDNGTILTEIGICVEPTTTTTTTTTCYDCATNDFTLYDDGLVTWTTCDGSPASIGGFSGETLSIPCHRVGTLSGPGITSNTVYCGGTCPTTTTTTTVL